MQLRNLIKATKNKYNRLLTVLILLYLFFPYAIDWSIGSTITFFVFLVAVTIVVYQIQHSRKILKIYNGLAFLAVLLQVLVYSPIISLQFSHFFDACINVIAYAFLALSIYLILCELIIAKQVTSDLVRGGICIYLLLGFLWSGIYDMIYSFDANAFSTISGSLSRDGLFYFSFTSLTTVGYGDICPVSRIARVLANLESVIGVLYPSVFIAFLVGEYSKDRTPSS
jgi:hypothetical protein